MKSPLRQVLHNRFDYAGLYPPASLEPAEVAREYDRLLAGEAGFMVRWLVCPAGRLTEIGAAIEQLEKPIPLLVSVTATPGVGLAGWQAALQADAEAIAAFQDHYGDQYAVEAYETVLPDEAEVDQIEADLDAIEGVDVYVEIPWSRDVADQVTQIEESEWLRAKLRCGGNSPDKVPPSLDLARFLRDAVDLDLHFKLTAGLHHAFRTFDPATGAETHGVLNILAAMGFHLHYDLTAPEIAAILEESNPAAFGLDNHQIRYRDRVLDWEELVSACAGLVGIGTCSLDEIVSELKAANLWRYAQ